MSRSQRRLRGQPGRGSSGGNPPGDYLCLTRMHRDLRSGGRSLS